MADSATIELKGDNADLKKSLNESENNFEKFGSNVKKIFLAIGAAIAVKKIFDFGSKLVDLTTTQSEAERKLEKALENSGNAAGFNAEQLKKRASELQTMTKFGDEVILTTQTMLAGFKNIQGDVFDRATVSILDMSEALGVGLAEANKKVALSLANPIEGMNALKESGVIFTDAQKEVIKQLVETGRVADAQRILLDGLEEKYGGSAADAADTFSGRMQQMWNRLGDVGEVIGAALIPMLDAFIPVLDAVGKVIEGYVAPMIVNVIGAFRDWVSAFYDDLKPAFTWLMNTAVEVFTAVQTTIENWSDTVGRSVLSFELTFIRTWENIKYWFTEVIPSVLQWFGENWKDILTDYANIQITIFDNMIKNFGAFIDAIKAYLAGEDWEVNWTPLTDGFESAIKKMPEIAERVKSDTEKNFEMMIKETDDRLGAAYAKNLERNKQILKDITTPAVSSRPSTGTNEKFDISSVTVKSDKTDVPKPATIPKVEVVKKPEEKAEEKGFQASLEDLVSLNSRITASAASSRPEEKVVGAVKELKEVAKNTHLAARERIEQERKAARDRAMLNEQMSALNVNLTDAIGLA